MSKSLWIAGAAALLSVATVAGVSAAGPMSPITGVKPASPSLVETVHCRRYFHCHRVCRWGRYRIWCWRACHRCG
ncbi:MAG TPA: hypothetical protein PK264_02605 [Hyphomicrobiaceae bacterium]|nr:hypothetical protein [Hyphomicrobiaceae bacterium]